MKSNIWFQNAVICPLCSAVQSCCRSMWGLREERWSGEWNSSFWWWKSQSLKLLMNKTLNSEWFHLAHWIRWRLGSREGQELKLFQRREIIYQMYIFLTASKLIVIYSKQSHYYYLKVVGKNIQITIMIDLLSQNLFHVQSWISSSFKFLPLFRIWPLASTITMTVPVSLTTWRLLEKQHTLLKKDLKVTIYGQILYGDYYCYHYMNCLHNYDYEVTSYLHCKQKEHFS